MFCDLNVDLLEGLTVRNIIKAKHFSTIHYNYTQLQLFPLYANTIIDVIITNNRATVIQAETSVDRSLLLTTLCCQLYD